MPDGQSFERRDVVEAHGQNPRVELPCSLTDQPTASAIPSSRLCAISQADTTLTTSFSPGSSSRARTREEKPGGLARRPDNGAGVEE